MLFLANLLASLRVSLAKLGWVKLELCGLGEGNNVDRRENSNNELTKYMRGEF